jgi:hypothetical protein
VHRQIAFLIGKPLREAAAMTELGFPSPWSVQEQDACFVVTDSTRQKLAYVYFEDDPRRRSVTKLLSRDEALRVAGQICRAADMVGHDILGF